MISLAIKHAWCHGLLTSVPETAPFDRFVKEAAILQVRMTGATPKSMTTPWSQMNLLEYQEAWKLMSQAAGVCGISVAEWELRVFQPGRGAAPLAIGAPLAPLASEKSSFLLANSFAAKPGDAPDHIAKCAGEDARHAAFLMGARPYTMSKASIESSFPGQFERFKLDSENEAWGVALQLSSGAMPNTRTAIEDAIVQMVARLREKFKFV